MLQRMTTLLLLVLLAACARPPQPTIPAQAVDRAGPSVWTADFIRTKPGQQERYLRYVDANWARARRAVLEAGHIRSFRVLVASDESAAPWDVALLTEYPDSATHARTEEIFRPVMAASGETLVDGLSGRGRDNPLKMTVFSTLLRSPIGSP